MVQCLIYYKRWGVLESVSALPFQIFLKIMLRLIQVYSWTLHTYHYFYAVVLLLCILIYQGIHPKTAFYYICSLLESLWKGRLFLGPLWISCTHMSFCFEGFYSLFNFLCCCAFTFHTCVRFVKGLLHEMELSILSLSSLIRLFLLCLLTFSAIATKYSLKVSAIFFWSVIFLPSTFRACISLLFYFFQILYL